VGGFIPKPLAASKAFWFAEAWSVESILPYDLTPSLWPFFCARSPMLTSAKLPSMAFLRNASLSLSFADALAIEIAIRVAVPSDKIVLFTAFSYRTVYPRPRHQSERFQLDICASVALPYQRAAARGLLKRGPRATGLRK